jgi:hypothetical protein
MRRLLTGLVLAWLLGSGCTAIPINLPAVDSGAAFPDGGNGGRADRSSADAPSSVGAPDAGAWPDGFEGFDGDARPDGWIPDACLGDAQGDAVCPPLIDGGPLWDAPGDGLPDDAPSPDPDAGSQDS